MKFRTRQLSNGKWVAEAKRFLCPWKGIDNSFNFRLHSSGSLNFRCCYLRTQADAEQALLEYKATLGL